MVVYCCVLWFSHVFFFFKKGRCCCWATILNLTRLQMNASIADKVSFSVLKDHDSLSQVLDVINSAYKVSESFFRNADHIDRISREGKLIS